MKKSDIYTYNHLTFLLKLSFRLLIFLLPFLFLLFLINPCVLPDLKYPFFIPEKPKVYNFQLLRLKPFKVDLHFPEQLDIRFFSKETRPDFQKSYEILIGRDKKSCRLNERLYLEANKELKFSDKKTLFWLTCKKFSSTAEFCIETGMQNNDIQLKKKNYEKPIEKIPAFMLKEVSSESPFSVFSKVDWLGPDHLFIHKNGCDQKDRLVFPDGTIQYVEKESFLVWDNDRWILADKKEDTKKFPLVRIYKRNNFSLDAEGWDLFGENKIIYRIDLKPPLPVKNSHQDFMDLPRLRGPEQVSCKIGKQRIFMKKNDVFLFKNNHWQKVSDVSDPNILDKEVFYFQDIEEINQEKFLIGWLYNPFRTQSFYIKRLLQKNFRERKKDTDLNL